jgi:cell division protein ZapA
LLASAKYLDSKMREVRDNGNIMGAERVAVITALNITNDFLSSTLVQKELGEELPPRLKNLETKISQALERARQLEI